VQFCRTLIISGMSLLLAACVSPKMSQEVQMGKTLFVAGDYKRSFHYLLPAAVCGNIQAQYAVGYMYYYGYGAPQDSESGLFWMNKAATSRYLPAIKALGLIAQGPPSYGPCRGAACYLYKGESGPIVSPQAAKTIQVPHLKRTYTSYLKDLRPPSAAPVQTIKVVPKDAPPPIVSKPVAAHTASNPATSSSYHALVKPMAADTASTNYALQLFGAYDVASVRDVQEDLELKHTRIWHTQNKGKDWYVLTFGDYSTVAQAKKDKGHLMAELEDIEPWVRKLEGLHRVG